MPCKAPKPLDGMNMWPYLQSNWSSPRTEVYYGVADHVVGRHGPALRTADGWKLLLNGGGGSSGWSPRRLKREKIYPMLFDLLKDPSETTDLSLQEPLVTLELGLRLKRYRQSAAPRLRLDRACGPFTPRASAFLSKASRAS